MFMVIGMVDDVASYSKITTSAGLYIGMVYHITRCTVVQFVFSLLVILCVFIDVHEKKDVHVCLCVRVFVRAFVCVCQKERR